MRPTVFRDRVKVYVRAGDGGKGAVCFRREKHVPRGGPSGGDGGDGGSVIFRADSNVDSLIDLYFSPHLKAEHGVSGSRQRCHGRRGKLLRMPVPCGTVVYDFESGDLIGELVEAGEELVVARGGTGGLGNCHFATPTNQAPMESTPGTPGEEKTLRLELKSVADIGLVGFPNAGKSTFLTDISGAHPKVAAYPFTTLNPIIGTVLFEDYHKLRVADIPGLIDGAHDGVGLGFEFLRHIERTRFLLFVIDMAGVDGREPWEDFRHLRRELELYNAELLQRPYMVLANKMDLPEALEKLPQFIHETGEKPLPVSAREKEGLGEVLDQIHDRFFDGTVPGAL